MDTNTDPTCWERLNRNFILTHLRVSGWDPPHPAIEKLNHEVLLAHLFELRNVRPEDEELAIKRYNPRRGRPPNKSFDLIHVKKIVQTSIWKFLSCTLRLTIDVIDQRL